MIWRVQGTDAFRQLHRGRRGSDGPLTVVVVPNRDGDGPVDPPRVAFAVGRRVGGAVVRNQVRRRLREHLRALERSGELHAADHLVIARPAAASATFGELGESLSRALRTAYAPRGADTRSAAGTDRFAGARS